MIPETDRAYIAGLFDGEGSIHFKRGPEKKKRHRGKPGYRISNSLRLSMEVTMTKLDSYTWLKRMMARCTPVKTLRTLFIKRYGTRNVPFLESVQKQFGYYD